MENTKILLGSFGIVAVAFAWTAFSIWLGGGKPIQSLAISIGVPAILALAIAIITDLRK